MTRELSRVSARSRLCSTSLPGGSLGLAIRSVVRLAFPMYACRFTPSVDTHLFAVIVSCGVALSTAAQPSGGPYGPVAQVYAVPTDAPHVYYVAPNGQPEAAGTVLAEPSTLESAVARATTGDVLVLRGGTYRTGNIRLNQGITFQPYRDEHPVWKGTLLATEWKALRDGLWRTSWRTLFPAQAADWWERDRWGRETPPYQFNNDMVFLEGERLHAVGWEGQLDAHSYYIDYATGQVYLAVDPTRRVVEITAYDNALTRTTQPINGRPSDRKGFTLRGVTLTQFAYRAIEVEGKEPEGLADPATFGKDVVGTSLENVAITHCSRVAGYFRGDHLTIRNCLISDTRTEGVYVLASADVLLERNIFRRNNIEAMKGYYPAAVKIFNQCYRAVCRDNLITDHPNSGGIWYDVGNVDGQFLNNWVEDTLQGFFFEISKGAVCAGNVFVDCDRGFYILNSANVQVYHNTFLNSPAVFERTERSALNDHFGWHPSTGPDVDKREGHIFVGNLLVADEHFTKPMVRFDQAKLLCGQLKTPQAAQIDGNVYIRAATSAPRPEFLLWAPANGESCKTEFASLDAFRSAQPDFEAHSLFSESVTGSIFRSPELNQLQLVHPIPSAVETPSSVRQLLNWPAQGPLNAGAFR